MTEKFGLTARQADLLRYIAQYIKDTGGISPSYDEMRIHLGEASKSGASRIVHELHDRGYVRFLPSQPRSITLNN